MSTNITKIQGITVKLYTQNIYICVMKKIPLWIWILLGMSLGVVWGMIAVNTGGQDFTASFIKPWGTIFVKLLKLIAVPLIFLSLVTGISSMGNIGRFSRLGLYSLVYYMATTLIAVCLGLILANSIRPGNAFPEEIRMKLETTYAGKTMQGASSAGEQLSQGPLSFIENMVPDNVFSAFSSNTAMLQVIVFSLFFGIALLKINPDKGARVAAVIDALNDIILKIVNMVMYTAPFGVFALIAGMITDIAGNDGSALIPLFSALGWYIITVIIGLCVLVFVVYPLLIFLMAPGKLRGFYRSVYPAQLLAFSTSSSAATLPLTMKCCEENLKLSPSVSRFVLPVGATINMDGTCLYQSVATIFIAQAFGISLDLTTQLTIIFTATMASIGSAAVPGAGMIMLVLVLQSAGLPVQGISLILAVDRILDMFRTVVNITSDSTVATVLNRKFGKPGV